MLPPVVVVPVTTPATLETTFMFVTFCWKIAPFATVGMQSFERLPVNGSIETQTYWLGWEGFWSSR